MAQRQNKTIILGLHSLDKRFAELAKVASFAQMITALMAGGEEIAEEARSLVPVSKGGGTLRDAIGVRKAPKKRRKMGAMVEVAVIGDPARYYAHLVEFGTRAHRITAKRGGFLWIGRRMVNHPGTAAQPFMRPALDTRRGAAVDATMRVLEAEISKVAKRGI
jgi:HK97 gp10 family phage protein